MKKLFLIIAMVAISLCSFAQITNIYPVKSAIDGTIDSTIVINRIYAGSLSEMMFSADSLYASGVTGFRVGAMATYQPTKWLAFKGCGMVQLRTGSPTLTAQHLWVKLNPTRKFSIELGNMSTIPSEQKPHPVSSDGQFETWTESQIPGVAINTKLKYQCTQNFQIASGIALRNNMPEYSARMIYKKVQLSGWYSEINKKFGTALTLNFNRVYNTFAWKQDQVISNFICVKFGKKKDYQIYSDNGYDLLASKLVRSETGVLKTFDSPYIKGLFGLGYQQETNTINGYIFVHL